VEVEHQCPQCGAPVTLDEADRLLACPFCKVSHYLVPRDTLRYFLKPSTDTDREIIFFPYWRLRGMFFSCRSYEVEQKVVDTSYLAIDSDILPLSLGLRTQALKLRFAGSGTPGRFVRPQISSDEYLRLLEPENTFHAAFIGETLSLVYAPTYLDKGRLCDAILSRPMPLQVNKERLQSLPTDETSSWSVSFVPALCPNCGRDMIAERDSSILPCTGCNTVWEISKEGFIAVPFLVLPQKEKTSDVIYLPFWKLKVAVEGITLETEADFIRLTNIPKVIRKGLDMMDFYFWCPAFKVPPMGFLRAARQMTVAQPDTADYETVFPGSPVHPASLSSIEASQAFKVTLASIATSKKVFFPQLPHVTARVSSHLLIYVPFRATPNELYHPQFLCPIERNALKTGRDI
jgi:ribosomal protein L37AE/L43A